MEEKAEFNSFDLIYKRHLTLEQAESMKASWDYEGADERRTSTIQYKSKTNDYTVKCGRHYNTK